ncbi:hypothetical protein P879_01603 [Paragonimus westermani]|uniref:U2A'/phosphoprotein 32 family A C-terminal domain-containing protein n=1 Tax=Paragonimus westermani TaxID=34504 RepID=A0A8T0DVY8_9TREM|nr:hypothetical protein P879_01603 [Paragonimus westermani]
MDTEKCAGTALTSEENAAAESREDKLEAYEIDEIEVPDCGSEDIDFEHCRIKSINHLNRFPNVKRLCLRNNLIKCLENFTPVASTLDELDLYDNQITKASFGFMYFLIHSTLCSKYPYLLRFPCNRFQFLAVNSLCTYVKDVAKSYGYIENLDSLVHLTVLDLSFNRIKHIENLGALVCLRKLFLVHNRISKIENLENLVQLEMLELGSNKLRRLENIDRLVNLTQLYVGKNKIPTLENMDNLVNLTLLSIQGNRITKIAGLDRLVNLEQLYLSENGITQIEGLENLHKLQILDLARNFISRIENISHLSELEEFWFNDNKVASWDQIEHLTVLKKLQTLYMERNPIYFANAERTRMDPNYRRKIMLTLPGLRQLDANLTGVGLNCTDSTELQLGV